MCAQGQEQEQQSDAFAAPSQEDIFSSQLTASQAATRKRSFLSNLGRDFTDLLASIPSFVKMMYDGASEWVSNPWATLKNLPSDAGTAANLVWSGVKEQYTNPDTGKFDLGHALYSRPLSTLLDATALFDAAGMGVKAMGATARAVKGVSELRLAETARLAGFPADAAEALRVAGQMRRTEDIISGAQKVGAFAAERNLPDLVNQARNVEQIARIDRTGDMISRLPLTATTKAIGIAWKPVEWAAGKSPGFMNAAQKLHMDFLFDPSVRKTNAGLAAIERLAASRGADFLAPVEQALGGSRFLRYPEKRMKLITEAVQRGEGSIPWGQLADNEKVAAKALRNSIEGVFGEFLSRGTLEGDLRGPKYGYAIQNEPGLRDAAKALFGWTDREIAKFYQPSFAPERKKALDFIAKYSEGQAGRPGTIQPQSKAELLASIDAERAKSEATFRANPLDPASRDRAAELKRVRSEYFEKLPEEGITAQYMPQYLKNRETLGGAIEPGFRQIQAISPGEITKTRTGGIAAEEAASGMEQMARMARTRGMVAELGAAIEDGRLLEALGGTVWRPGMEIPAGHALFLPKLTIRFLSDESAFAQQVIERLRQAGLGVTGRGLRDVIRDLLGRPTSEIQRMIREAGLGSDLGSVWLVPKGPLLEFQRRFIGNVPGFVGRWYGTANELFKAGTLAFGMGPWYWVQNVVTGAVQYLLSGGGWKGLALSRSPEMRQLLPRHLRVGTSPEFIRWNEAIERIPPGFVGIGTVIKGVANFARDYTSFANRMDDIFRRAAFLSSVERDARLKIMLDAGRAFYESAQGWAETQARVAEVLGDARTAERIKKAEDFVKRNRLALAAEQESARREARQVMAAEPEILESPATRQLRAQHEAANMVYGSIEAAKTAEPAKWRVEVEKLAAEHGKLSEILRTKEAEYPIWKEAREQTLTAQVMKGGKIKITSKELPEDFPGWLKTTRSEARGADEWAADLGFESSNDFIAAIQKELPQYSFDYATDLRNRRAQLQALKDEVVAYGHRLEGVEAMAGPAAQEQIRKIDAIRQQLGASVAADIEQARLGREGKLQELSARRAAAEQASETLRARVDAFRKQIIESDPKLRAATAAVKRASDLTDTFLFNYYLMNSTERLIAKNVIPFWYWLRNSMALWAKLPFIAPTRTFAWQRFAHFLADTVEDHDKPEFLRGYVAFGVNEFGHPLWFNVGRALFPFSIPNVQHPEETLLTRMNPFIETAWDIIAGRAVFRKVEPAKQTLVTANGRYFEYDPVQGVVRRKPEWSIYDLPQDLVGLAKNFYPFAYFEQFTRDPALSERGTPEPGATDAEGKPVVPLWAVRVIRAFTGTTVRTGGEVQGQQMAALRAKQQLIVSIKSAMRRNPQDVPFLVGVLRDLAYQNVQDF